MICCFDSSLESSTDLAIERRYPPRALKRQYGYQLFDCNPPASRIGRAVVICWRKHFKCFQRRQQSDDVVDFGLLTYYGEESQEEKRLKTSISDNKLVHVVSKWSKTE